MLYEGKVQKGTSFKRAKHSSVGEKRIFSTSTVSSIFKSKEVVDISVLNLENNEDEDPTC